MSMRREVQYLRLAKWIVQISRVVTKGSERGIIKPVQLEDIREVWANCVVGQSELGKGSADYSLELDPGEGPLVMMRKRRGDFAVISRWESEGKVVVSSHVNLLGINFVLRQILFLLTKNKGVVLHASSVVDDKGRLHVFMAESGGGKSTTAKLMANDKRYKLVSDDSLLVVKESGRDVCYATGLSEKELSPQVGRYEEFSFYEVHKSEESHVRDVREKAEILKLLLSQTWFENERPRKGEVKYVAELARKITLRELCLRLNDEEAATLIYED